MFNRHTQPPASPEPGQEVVWTSTNDPVTHSGKVTKVVVEGDSKNGVTHTRITVEEESEQQSKRRK